MVRLKLLILSVLLSNVGHISCQAPGSGGMVVGALGSAIQSFMSNGSNLNMVRDILTDPAAFMSNGSAPRQVLGMLSKVQTGQVGAGCLQHMGILGTALTQQQEWALRMIDAIGKPPSGLLNFKLLWVGDWEECTSTKAMVYQNVTLKSNPSSPFSGKYCPMNFKLPVPTYTGQKAVLTIGACFPDSCSAADATAMLNTLVALLPGNASNSTEAWATCQENDLPLDTRAIIVIVVCFAFVTMMTLATIYDVVYVNWIAKKALKKANHRNQVYQNGLEVEGGAKRNDAFVMENGSQNGNLNEKQDNWGKTIQLSNLNEKLENGEIPTQLSEVKQQETESPKVVKYQPSVLEGIVLSFSVFTNGTKILSTHQPKGALTAVHGIRFISMAWVIVGHGFGWALGLEAANSVTYAPDLLKRREFTPIANGTFSVDTFFVLSGLLVSYLSLREMKKVNGIRGFKWGMFYFHRIWRLTPPYLLLLMIHVSLDKYLGDGPMWPQGGFEREACAKSWWSNALYINNLVKNDKSLTCFGWTWYLANDMQFYIISPLALIPLFISPVLGGVACLALLLVSSISAGLISMHYELPSSSLFNQAKSSDYMWQYYVKPWCRVGPYAVGLFTGYMLYRYQLKMKINKFLNVILWIGAIAMGCLIIYGLYSDSLELKDPLTQKQAAVYNATARIAWGACVAWVIYACANGYGGPVNHLLSWSGFVPLGRLTYFAYLVHPMLMSIKKMTVLSTGALYDYGMVYLILGHLCMSYGMAFVLSLAFEAPMMGLEKVLLGRGKTAKS